MPNSPLVLSLFPGIGLLDMAFEQEGFCVVRGPDLLWGGDIKSFHPPAGRFDGVIGGPPCQAFSSLRFLIRSQGHKIAENLIPEFSRCVLEASPEWFLMENVRKAPEPEVKGYQLDSFLLNNRWLGEKQSRLRKFWFGTKITDGKFLARPQLAALEHIDFATAVLACELTGGMSKLTHYPRVSARVHKGRSFPLMCQLQGLPEGFDLPPFTREGKGKAVGNGVPLPMGRAIANAIKLTLYNDHDD